MSAPIRIGVNLLWLVPGEVGGSEEYTVRLLAAFADASYDDVELVLYVNRAFPDAHPELAQRFLTRIAPITGTSRGLRVLVESTWLALRTRRDRCRAVHHAGGTMPILRGASGIVTMHDLQPLANPERFGVVKGAYIRFIAPRSVRNAKRVVCLSEFVAGDVANRVGISRNRISIVPCGVEDPGVVFDSTRLEELLDDLSLTDRPFILYPAITYPHKNHVMLVAAFARVHEDHPDARLVLTGGAGASDEVVGATVRAYGLESSVVRTGRIPEGDLNLLYRAATLMAFPSLYEGFGLPVLEAMSRGCPVVASTAGALPEVLGGAGELVDPVDCARWAEVVGELLDDPDRRTVLLRRGFSRVAQFDWQTSAQALHTVYREFR